MKYIKFALTGASVIITTLLILSIFFPMVLFYALCAIIPLTAFVIIRVKYGLGTVIPVLILTLGLCLNFSYTLLIVSGVYVFSVVGTVIAIRLKYFIRGIAVIAGSTALAFVLIFSMFFAFTGQSPLDAIPDYITKSNNQQIYEKAKPMLVNYIMEQDYRLLEGAERQNALIKTQKYVDECDSSIVFNFYANHARWWLYQNITYVIFGAIMAICITSIIIATRLALLGQKDLSIWYNRIISTRIYEVSCSHDMRLPRGYLLAVLIPLMLTNLLSETYESCHIISETLSLAFINIPFFIFGAVAVIKFIIQTNNYLLPLIVVILAVFVGINVIVFLGILHYFLSDIIQIDKNIMKDGI